MVTEIAIGQIIQDFSVIMIVASAMAFISFKLKQPLVIGYIIAGIIIVVIDSRKRIEGREQSGSSGVTEGGVTYKKDG